MHRGLRLAQGDVHGSGPLRFEDDLELADAVVDRAELIGQRASGVELERVTFKGCALSGTELESSRLTDVRFEQCDLSGLVLLECSIVRLALCECRIAGSVVSRGSAVGLSLVDCRGSEAAFFGVDGRDWVFEGCELDEPDFRELRLTGGRFERCRFTAADFGGARVAGVSIRESVLDGLGGAGGLSGATVDTGTLLSMAPGLAAALGIGVTA